MYAMLDPAPASPEQIERLAQIEASSSTYLRTTSDSEFAQELIATQRDSNRLARENNTLLRKQTHALRQGLDNLESNLINTITAESYEIRRRLDLSLELQIAHHSEITSQLDEVNSGIRLLVSIAKDQRREQRRSNLLLRNPDQTKAGECFAKGKKRIMSLGLISDTTSRHNEISAAIQEFKQAVELDPFNEQSLLQLSIWCRHIDDRNEEWIHYLRETKIRATVELKNSGSEQKRIAESTLNTLCFCAPTSLVDSGFFSIYINEFQDFCEEQSNSLSKAARLHVVALGIAANILNNTEYQRTHDLAQAAISTFGAEAVFDKLLSIRSVAQQKSFIRLYTETTSDIKKALIAAIDKIESRIS
jgi:hypothetical protein